jgi:putative addiction module killer protein
MREDFGPGRRMDYAKRGNELILMLGGGDKSTQQKDIETAIALNETIVE